MMLAEREFCCGCASCAQLCPRNCISMVEDESGFPYPAIDASRCIDCGKCGEVCPALHKRDARLPESVYAAVNNDAAVRGASSSGGMSFAEATYEQAVARNRAIVSDPAAPAGQA